MPAFCGMDIDLRIVMTQLIRCVLCCLIIAVYTLVGGRQILAEVTGDSLRMSVINHKIRLKRGMVATMSRASMYLIRAEYFPDLNVDIVSRFSALHDMPKLMTVAQLKKFDYPYDESIGDILAKEHGANWDLLSGAELQQRAAARVELNRIEGLMKKAFYVQEGLSQQQIEQLEHLEHIWDLTDTGLFRREEVGANDLPYDGARYLISRYGDSPGALVSIVIEDQFEELTGVRPPMGSNRCRNLFSFPF